MNGKYINAQLTALEHGLTYARLLKSIFRETVYKVGYAEALEKISKFYCWDMFEHEVLAWYENEVGTWAFVKFLDLDKK